MHMHLHDYVAIIESLICFSLCSYACYLKRYVSGLYYMHCQSNEGSRPQFDDPYFRVFLFETLSSALLKFIKP